MICAIGSSNGLIYMTCLVIIKTCDLDEMPKMLDYVFAMKYMSNEYLYELLM